MAGDPDIAALNRTMKDVVRSLQDVTRIMVAVNTNLVDLVKRIPPQDDPNLGGLGG